MSIRVIDASNCSDTDFSSWWARETSDGSLDHFFKEIRGVQPCIIRGSQGRFSSVISWNDLNNILNTHRLQTPRLRFVKDGQSVPEVQYAAHRQSTSRGNEWMELIPEQIHELMRNGAAMVLDGVDQLVPTVGEVAASMESFLEESVNANLYCAFNGSKGFSSHWDAHDVYVIQVGGSKNWKIYKGGREAPMEKDVFHVTESPTELLWQGDLCDGDVLYLPRGTWHEATADDTYSLHITFGCNHATGVDFLDWLADKLRSKPEMRRDIISFCGDSNKNEYTQLLQNILSEAISPETLEEYLRYRATRQAARNRVQLPEAVRSTSEFLGEGVYEFCSPNRFFTFDEEKEKVILSIAGKTFRLRSTYADLIQHLVQIDNRFTFVELCDSVANENVTRYSVRQVLLRLVREGVLWKST